MMTEIKTIEGGQKDVHRRRANIKKRFTRRFFSKFKFPVTKYLSALNYALKDQMPSSERIKKRKKDHKILRDYRHP